jgi:hypothetical protein
VQGPQAVGSSFLCSSNRQQQAAGGVDSTMPAYKQTCQCRRVQSCKQTLSSGLVASVGTLPGRWQDSTHSVTQPSVA